ncbi:hypothetical protein HPB47_025930 [Ixodes persulcatus]|uniref:Uncharacterized protein n=1 Tax=Ixodes persulcatus TaxID=34615 RepID=A0AC60Q1C3_IXOPE|nr:hypothetical protein HPB47_025930 [Ixodes persulcatus]
MLSLNNKPAPTDAAVPTSPQLGASQLAGQPSIAAAALLTQGGLPLADSLMAAAKSVHPRPPSRGPDEMFKMELNAAMALTTAGVTSEALRLRDLKLAEMQQMMLHLQSENERLQETFEVLQATELRAILGCTPNGYICHVTGLWGGSASYRTIVEESVLMGQLKPVDAIMVEGGFKDLPPGVQVHIPPFRQPHEPQMSEQDVAHTRQVASARMIRIP